MNRGWLATGPGRLGLVAVVLLGVAVVLRIMPVRTAVAPRLPVLADAGMTAPSPNPAADTVAAWQQTVVATNLFSGGRRAPTERFRMPGLAAAPDAMAPTSDPLPENLALAVDRPEPVLLGIVRVNGVRQALIGFSSPDSASRLISVGGRVGAYRLRAIGTDQVDLQSPAGPRTLRLPRPSPSDSSELLP